MDTIDDFLKFDPTDELESRIDEAFQQKQKTEGYATAVYDLLMTVILEAKWQRGSTNSTSPKHNYIEQEKLAENARYLAKHQSFIREKLFS